MPTERLAGEKEVMRMYKTPLGKREERKIDCQMIWAWCEVRMFRILPGKWMILVIIGYSVGIESLDGEGKLCWG